MAEPFAECLLAAHTHISRGNYRDDPDATAADSILITSAVVCMFGEPGNDDRDLSLEIGMECESSSALGFDDCFLQFIN